MMLHNSHMFGYVMSPPEVILVHTDPGVYDIIYRHLVDAGE